MVPGGRPCATPASTPPSGGRGGRRYVQAKKRPNRTDGPLAISPQRRAGRPTAGKWLPPDRVIPIGRVMIPGMWCVVNYVSCNYVVLIGHILF